MTEGYSKEVFSEEHEKPGQGLSGHSDNPTFPIHFTGLWHRESTATYCINEFDNVYDNEELSHYTEQCAYIHSLIYSSIIYLVPMMF